MSTDGHSVATQAPTDPATIVRAQRIDDILAAFRDRDPALLVRAATEVGDIDDELPLLPEAAHHPMTTRTTPATDLIAAGSPFAGLDLCRAIGLRVRPGSRGPVFDQDVWDFNPVTNLAAPEPHSVPCQETGRESNRHHRCRKTRT
jgi:hypothetical protein